jgi:hypothetical protein
MPFFAQDHEEQFPDAIECLMEVWKFLAVLPLPLLDDRKISSNNSLRG